jgi:hypothetical protein
VVLGASTLASHRKNSWRISLTQGLGSLLWASPVIAVMAFVAMRVVPHFQFGTANQRAADALPTWLHTEGVIDVPAFVDQTTPVSIDADSGDSLPSWTTQEVSRLKSSKGNPRNVVWRVVKESSWEKSVEEARRNLVGPTSELVQQDFDQFFPGGSNLPQEVIQKHVVRAEAVKSQVHEDVDTPFTMYKVYWQVELSSQVREALSDTWKTEIATKRAWLLGEVLGLLTLIAVSFAAYFHLDKKSDGAYRFRLKLAATSLMTAGGLGLIAALSQV